MLGRRFRAGIAAASLIAVNSGAFLAMSPSRADARPAAPTAEELGRGWGDALICIGCLTAAGLAVYSGAAAWGALVANPAATGALIATCVDACESAYGK